MTIYYSPYTAEGIKTTAFQKGFRMFVGDPTLRDKARADKYRQLTYTCLQTPGTRTGETKNLPDKPCPAGIMANLRFPTYVEKGWGEMENNGWSEIGVGMVWILILRIIRIMFRTLVLALLRIMDLVQQRIQFGSHNCSLKLSGTHGSSTTRVSGQPTEASHSFGVMAMRMKTLSFWCNLILISCELELVMELMEIMFSVGKGTHFRKLWITIVISTVRLWRLRVLPRGISVALRVLLMRILIAVSSNFFSWLLKLKS